MIEGKSISRILLVEDNPADAFLAKATFDSISEELQIKHLHDGEAALEFIESCEKGSFPEGFKPDIILIDLNLPKISGKEVLSKIKSTNLFNDIRVVVLSGSTYSQDVEDSIKIGADYYLVKPFSTDDFLGVI